MSANALLLYGRAGKRQEAQKHLAIATTMYRKMDVRYWLEKAEAEPQSLAKARVSKREDAMAGSDDLQIVRALFVAWNADDVEGSLNG